MTDNHSNAISGPADYTDEAFEKRLRHRRAKAKRLKIYGITAIALALTMLATLLVSISIQAYPAFFQTQIRLELYFDPEVIDPEGERVEEKLKRANYNTLIGDALKQRFPNVEDRATRFELTDLVSRGAGFRLGHQVANNMDLIGQRKEVWLTASDDVDQLIKGNIPRDVPEAQRRVSNQQLEWIDQLKADGDLEKQFNLNFFTDTDSREPELAGVWGAIVGSFFTMIITLSLAFPVAVAAAVYLEEFAPRNRWTDIIEVNINNLIAVPSIVFGLLGLAFLLNFFNLPRSTPLVGGIVLALMTLPIIIISARSALKAVPPSVREAALAMGASPVQVVWFHVLPLALPGILTGTIIGMAQALGETAPLLLIGMVAFVVSVPDSFTDQATVLPVQIYIWSTSPERAFLEKSAAAILVLLTFLLLMNGTAIWLRKKLQRRW
jgi:phosphate transport system permease protein